MATLSEQINEDLKTAMRAKQVEKISTLRMLISAIRNKEISLRAGEKVALEDDKIIEVIKSEIKKRKDSAEAYEQGGRSELAEKEKTEIEILNKYLPEQMSEEEVERIAAATIAEFGEVTMKDFGKIMGEVMKKAKGKADGNMASAAVKKILGK